MKGSSPQHRLNITALFILLILSPFLFHNNNVTVESFSYHGSSSSSSLVPLESLRGKQEYADQRRHNNNNIRKNNNILNLGTTRVSTYNTKPISTSTSLSSVSAAVAAFPSLKDVIMTCLTPTLLGFYKSEYGVSYGYGTATAATAFLAYRSVAMVGISSSASPLAGLAKCQAMAVIFYGIRLNLFLLYRELFLPRFRDMRERIEERAMSKGGRWKRTPFILSCAGLYVGLAAPTLITTKLAITSAVLPPTSCFWGKMMMAVFRGSVYATWGGFILGAIGDLTKSFYKATKGDDYLVTNGIFRFLRHPNYTGEIIAWTANCLAALTATAMCLKTAASWKAFAPSLILSMASLPGIVSVLLAATMNLEQKQRIRYEDNEDYAKWKKNSWVGLTFDLSAWSK